MGHAKARLAPLDWRPFPALADAAWSDDVNSCLDSGNPAEDLAPGQFRIYTDGTSGIGSSPLDAARWAWPLPDELGQQILAVAALAWAEVRVIVDTPPADSSDLVVTAGVARGVSPSSLQDQLSGGLFYDTTSQKVRVVDSAVRDSALVTIDRSLIGFFGFPGDGNSIGYTRCLGFNGAADYVTVAGTLVAPGWGTDVPYLVLTCAQASALAATSIDVTVQYRALRSRWA